MLNLSIKIINKSKLNIINNKSKLNLINNKSKLNNNKIIKILNY